MVRLFAWLDDIGRYGGGPSMLRPAWGRLAELLEGLARTEQAGSTATVTWPDAVREAIRAAQMHDPGSAAWWNGVHAARSACRDEFTVA